MSAAPRHAFAALLALAALLPRPAAAQRAARADRASADRILADVRWLADDRREGRMTGTPGSDSAAAYIARRFAALGLRPVVTLAIDSARADRCVATHARTVGLPGRAVERTRCAAYEQPFVARSAALAHLGARTELPTQNVVALVEGTDPALRGQVVVLGAHYDHLGRERFFSTDPQAGDAIRNGADDNASGTAAVLELARLLAAHPPRRSVLLALFAGEEEGLLGSQWFVEHAPVPMDSVAAMLNFDMVGRLTNDRLLVYGVATATELPALVDSLNAAGPRLAVRAIGDGFGPSDHSSFFAKNVPVLHFFTDQHADYHAATDDWEKIDAPGEARVVDLALGIARTIADRPARLTFQRGTAMPRVMGATTDAPRPWLGSVPDMSDDGAHGMRLQGVTPDSPADRAGLRAGDVVVAIDGSTVTDLQSYSDALYSHKPGDVVDVVVLRGDASTIAGAAPQRVTLRVTLGRRGQ